MNQRSAGATKSNKTLRDLTLTVAQENAIDALVTGKTDAETAKLVGVNRVTVTRWRLYNPHFQAALHERRKAVWSAGVDRLRSFIPLALDAIEDALTSKYNGATRVKMAVTLLKLLPATLAPENSPTDPNEIVRGIVDDQRDKSRSPADDIIDHGQGLPGYEDHVNQVWGELAEKLEADTTEPSEHPASAPVVGQP